MTQYKTIYNYNYYNTIYHVFYFSEVYESHNKY